MNTLSGLSIRKSGYVSWLLYIDILYEGWIPLYVVLTSGCTYRHDLYVRCVDQRVYIQTWFICTLCWPAGVHTDMIYMYIVLTSGCTYRHDLYVHCVDQRVYIQTWFICTLCWPEGVHTDMIYMYIVLTSGCTYRHGLYVHVVFVWTKGHA